MIAQSGPAVWRGTDDFSLIGSGLPDAQTTLVAVAQAILATNRSLARPVH